MSKKRKKPPATPPSPGATPLTGGRLILARELAKQGIAFLLPDSEIIKSIVEQCLTTERSAAAAVREVAKMASEMPEVERDDLRRVIHYRLEALYAQAAQTGKVETAAKMLDRRARLAQLFDKDQGRGPVKEVDEFEGRTLEDIGYFRENGHWPEERPPDNVVPIDPLARLRKQAQ